MLKDGEEVPVEPSETLVGTGWLPGTWVRYAATPVNLTPGAIAMVDKSDGEGVLCGFLMYGPQHKQPVVLLSDMWNDQIQRAGGDTHYDWSGVDAGGPLVFDEQNQLQRLGSRIVTMYVPPTGFFKFYVFETEDLTERTTPGTGAPLVYAPNDKLYVSDQGLLTNEQEGAAHPWTGYVVARVDNDEEGDYLIITAAVA
jgi:hypothetical protein